MFGRLLWGLAWSGIWVGGNAMVLDISNDESRGRWMGLYQFSFFLGAASGAMVGGTLTDRVGFNQAMLVGAVVTLIGAVIALIFLPETRNMKGEPTKLVPDSTNNSRIKSQFDNSNFATATALFGINRLVIPGILSSTLGIFLFQQVGEQTQIAGLHDVARGTAAAEVVGGFCEPLHERAQGESAT